MFLHRFVRRRRLRCRRRRPQILVHAITFEQLFGFHFWHDCWPWPKDYLIRILVDFHRDFDLEFSRSNMELAISQPKMVQLPRNEKQTYWLKHRPQMRLSGLTLGVTLTLNFPGQIWNLLYFGQKWSYCLETKNKFIDWTQVLKGDHRFWPWP